MATHGSTDSRSGAIPAATSQLQFKATPAAAIATAANIKPRFPLVYGHRALTVFWASETVPTFEVISFI
ncbi:MAG: hypothetical protein RIC16_03955 [Rhodospirillales bacterium]